MGRFETKWLCRPENLAALAALLGQRIDEVPQRRPPKMMVLDVDSSESPTCGEQERDVTPVTDDFRADLDQLSRRLVSDHGFAVFGSASAA